MGVQMSLPSDEKLSGCLLKIKYGVTTSSASSTFIINVLLLVNLDDKNIGG